MSVAVIPGNFSRIKKQRRRKAAGQGHDAAFFHLCLPRAKLWLQGKLGPHWADNQQQRRMTGISLSSQIPQSGQGVGEQASSLTWPGK